MTASEHWAADRRLIVLRLLREAGGEANESSIHSAVKSMGHPRHTRDLTLEDVDWLKARKLVTTRLEQETVLIARVTRRGVDAANGDIEVEGVKRPSIV